MCYSRLAGRVWLAAQLVAILYCIREGRVVGSKVYCSFICWCLVLLLLVCSLLPAIILVCSFLVFLFVFTFLSFFSFFVILFSLLLVTAIDCSPCRHIVSLGLASFDLILILKTIICLRAGAVVFCHICIALITTVVVVVVMVVIVGYWSIVIVMVVTDLIWGAALFGRFIRKVFLVNLILILSEILVGVTVVLKILISRHGGG